MNQTFCILHLRASNFVGGPERQVLRYAEFERQGPVEITLASFVGDREGKEFIAVAEQMGFSILPLPAGLHGALKSVSELAHFIRQRRVSLVCTHGYRADILGIRAARKCGVPVACFLRGWTKENWKVGGYEALDRTLLPRATRIVALSETQAASLRNQKGLADKVRVVVNAIEVQNVTEDERQRVRLELRERLGLSADAPVVATSGRLSPEKGAAIFIQAIPAIRERFPGARFVLFGDGPLRYELEALAKQCGLSGQIHFAGFVPGFPRLLPGVDVLVNPSLSEQMPNVVLEAMSAGVPVVATAVGGVPEICGDNALVLVPPSDSNALGRAVADLLADPARARVLGLAGQKRVAEAYSPARQRDQLRALYEEFIPSLKSSRSIDAVPAAGSPLDADRDGASTAPFISIVIPVRNEEAHLGAVLDALLAQGYPRERFEILVADGESTDGTREVVENSARSARVRILCLPNPRRLSSAGRNVGVRASRGDIIIFIDGHCRVPNRNLLADTASLMQEKGADCLCRPQPLAAPDNSSFQDVVAHARATFLGHGPESTIYVDDFHGYVSPVSSGAIYKRSVFDQIGMFDENFDACEDVEFNHRVHKAGLRSYLSSRLAVTYKPRSTPRGLFKQLFRYGRGRFRFMLKHPDAASITQFIPAAFVAWILFGAFGSFISSVMAKLYLASLTAYGVVVLWYSVKLGLRYGMRELVVAPLIYLLMHVGLGAGFWLEAVKYLLQRVGVVRRMPTREHIVSTSNSHVQGWEKGKTK